MRKPYPTDLSDDEWNYIEPHMPPPLGYGRPSIHRLREILNAIFYVLRSGCQRRLLPHGFLGHLERRIHCDQDNIDTGGSTDVAG
jgi:putative transposase